MWMMPGVPMSQYIKAPKARLTTVAEFPKNYFLENLAVRSDNLNSHHGDEPRRTLRTCPAADGDGQVAPMLLHRFDMLTMGNCRGRARCLPDAGLQLLHHPSRCVLYQDRSLQALAAGVRRSSLRCSARFRPRSRGLNAGVACCGLASCSWPMLSASLDLARRLRSGRRRAFGSGLGSRTTAWAISRAG